MLLPLVMIAACQNTNPEKGTGGNHVEEKTVLSNKSIVDSAKSVLDQSFALHQQLQKGKITDADFEKQNASLMVHFESLNESLSPADTLIIKEYKEERERVLAEQNKKNNSSGIWE